MMSWEKDRKAAQKPGKALQRNAPKRATVERTDRIALSSLFDFFSFSFVTHYDPMQPLPQINPKHLNSLTIN